MAKDQEIYISSGMYVIVPLFDGFDESEIDDATVTAWHRERSFTDADGHTDGTLISGPHEGEYMGDGIYKVTLPATALQYNGRSVVKIEVEVDGEVDDTRWLEYVAKHRGAR